MPVYNFDVDDDDDGIYHARPLVNYRRSRRPERRDRSGGEQPLDSRRRVDSTASERNPDWSRSREALRGPDEERHFRSLSTRSNRGASSSPSPEHRRRRSRRRSSRRGLSVDRSRSRRRRWCRIRRPRFDHCCICGTIMDGFSGLMIQDPFDMLSSWGGQVFHMGRRRRRRTSCRRRRPHSRRHRSRARSRSHGSRTGSRSRSRSSGFITGESDYSSDGTTTAENGDPREAQDRGRDDRPG